MLTQPKVALVHDDLAQFGGAERLFLALRDIWPCACLYTSLVGQGLQYQTLKIHQSWMDKLPFKSRLYRLYFPLYPFAFESFDLRDFDMVISSSSRYAHGVITKPGTIHVWYCHTPSRIIWDTQRYMSPNQAKLLSPWLNYYRLWDQTAASRVNLIIANSQNTSKRIKQIYGRESIVIYPFVDTGYFFPSSEKSEDYLLVVSRLLPYKRIDLAIEACNKLKKELIVVGKGLDEARLKKMAGPTIKFKGTLTEKELLSYYQKCKGLIVPGEEDFGMVALEALACGKPVIAFNRGGVTEIITHDLTGLFFVSPNSTSLIDCLKIFGTKRFLPKNCRARAEQFSKAKFIFNLEKVVENVMKGKQDV